MTLLRIVPRFAVLVAILLGSLSLSGSAVTGQQATGTPVLLSALAHAADPGVLVVRGDHFTPGGDVFVAIHDPWGERSFETRWTTASEVTFDMLGHDDPSLGFRPGGTVQEAFSHLCGQQVMVRAYDRTTATWSNVLDIQSVC